MGRVSRPDCCMPGEPIVVAVGSFGYVVGYAGQAGQEAGGFRYVDQWSRQPEGDLDVVD
jgi:hypothetical protein